MLTLAALIVIPPLPVGFALASPKVRSMEFVKDSVFNHSYPFESDLIDIKKYFEDFAEKLIPFEKCQEGKCRTNEGTCETEGCLNDEFYCKHLGISKSQLKELKERTSVDQLTCDGEIIPVSHEFYKKFSEDSLKQRPKSKNSEQQGTSLISVEKRAEMSRATKTELSRSYFRYNNYQWFCTTEKTKTKLDFKTDDFSNIIACVKVYHPFLSNRTKPVKVKLLQEIHILGNQTLSDLRDKIICFIDYIGDRDLSSECFLKDVGLNIIAKNEYPSSFIFIENTFYNDTRTPDLVDLSKVIREWGPSRGLGPFDCKSMESTKISDINLKIGRPYVFQHQGDCEHLIIFSDLRFAELTDYAKSSCYPRIHCGGRIYGKHCMMCADSYARWLVVGNDRLTHDKTYLCHKCFISYNYINGQKIGQFEAYKYVDPISIL